MKQNLIVLFSALFFLNFQLMAQNPAYRVEKIVTILEKGGDKVDTLSTVLSYNDAGKLIKVTTYNGFAIKEEHFCHYSGNSITVKDGWNNQIRYYELDSLERVVLYKSGPESVKVTYEGNVVKTIIDEQRIEGENFIDNYVFKYTPDYKRINSVACIPDPLPRGYNVGDYDYYYFYNRDPKTYSATTVKRIDLGKANQYLGLYKRYIIKWDNDKIVAISTQLPDKSISESITFKYDEFGNIAEEYIKTHIFGGFIISRIEITYSQKVGNDHIVWGFADWFYNKMINQRTYRFRKISII